MNDLMYHGVFLLVGAMLMLILMGLSLAILVPISDRWSKRFFIVFFAILLLGTSLVLTDCLIQNHPDTVSRTVLQLIYYLETLILSIQFPALLAFLLHCCGENLRTSRFFHLEIVLWALAFAMLNTTPFTTWFYYISPENRLRRGPLYPVMMGVFFAMILLVLGSIFHYRNRLSKKYYLAFLLGVEPLSVVMFLHFFISVFPLIILGIAICAFSMYIIILSDQIEQDLHHQREIARQQQAIAQQRASIIVLQMRPHFIYNTMTSIYCLCSQSTEKAQQVIMDFTNYLRRNFNAIVNDNVIPFSTELEHTRAYLAVEQVQHPKSLFVDYDTLFTYFRLPPLTLQPLAENAVKHGMNPDADPLRISIRTRHTDFNESGRSAAEIIVEDTGPGFDPSDESKPHTTLGNIRQRLEMMCDGSMTIQPREGRGTVVTIMIPLGKDINKTQK